MTGVLALIFPPRPVALPTAGEIHYGPTDHSLPPAPGWFAALLSRELHARGWSDGDPDNGLAAAVVDVLRGMHPDRRQELLASDRPALPGPTRGELTR